MPQYDSIVILGSQPDPRNWQFPSHVYRSIARAVELLSVNASQNVIVSGDRAIRFDILGIAQPFRECDCLAELLLARGVPAERILREGESRDTPSNFFFIKTLITEPLKLRSLLIVAADFRVKRVTFLAERILGPSYVVDVEEVASSPDEVYPNEAKTFERNKHFLEAMVPGDETFLEGKFFSDPFYGALRERLLSSPPEERLFS